MSNTSQESYNTRKNEILDCAQRFFYTKGYEHTTVAMIINELTIAKGTFYHYFDSKDTLLNEVIARLVTAIEERIEAIVMRTDITALEKLNRFFIDVTEYKIEQKEAVIAAARVINSEENIVLREKLTRKFLQKSEGYLQQVIAQGRKEGLFDVENVPCLARILLNMMESARDMVVALLNAPHVDQQQIHELHEAYVCIQQAMERVLQAPPGSIQLLSREHIQAFFT